MAEDYIPIKRPKPGDGEEEILQMQEEFMQNKLSPCAKVINLRTEYQKENLQAKKESKFAKNRGVEAQNKRISTNQGYEDFTNVDTDLDNSKQCEENNFDPIHNYLKLSSHIILGNVVERKLNVTKFNFKIDEKVKESLKVGFPTVFEVSETLPIENITIIVSFDQ
ncbi:PREDICTED: uncharacterized protein LOC105363299 [Ceratosolen solmsi marchali]|uniref:Uncharacterized protein LOC105363299 n=1 Tax=Ceratosolen solmsi marchali TaxID=326594 RepID=A0AAJ6YJL7_9HYME|nr:PREDICTED: uncharacterized protein LOC105363299 [Ceratosolen solmsi marchali]